MMTHFRRLALAALAATSLASCYYPGGYDTGYNSGYSDSYGFSGAGTSFVYTSSDRWFYDSSVRCYYDRTRHCYYDPWLNGYYPRGYCPRPVAHVPHPYGWNGRGSCPPPRGVRNQQIDRYKDRMALLRAKNHAWARNVQEKRSETAHKWQEQRARQAATFANNRTQPSRGNNAAHRPTPPNQQASGNSARRGHPTQSSAQPRFPSSQPPRPQVQSSGRNRPQATQQPRQPSRPSVKTTRPGYNQPVATRSSSSNNGRSQGQPKASSRSQSQPKAQSRPSAPAAKPWSSPRGNPAAGLQNMKPQNSRGQRR